MATTAMLNPSKHDCGLMAITFRGGEWRTGAGGEGGPLGSFLLILKRGGSIGSRWTSTRRMTRCLAPELKASPCCEGV